MFKKILIGAVLAVSGVVSNVQAMEFATVDGADSVRGGGWILASIMPN